MDHSNAWISFSMLKETETLELPLRFVFCFENIPSPPITGMSPSDSTCASEFEFWKTHHSKLYWSTHVEHLNCVCLIVHSWVMLLEWFCSTYPFASLIPGVSGLSSTWILTAKPERSDSQVISRTEQNICFLCIALRALKNQRMPRSLPAELRSFVVDSWFKQYFWKHIESKYINGVPSHGKTQWITLRRWSLGLRSM